MARPLDAHRCCGRRVPDHSDVAKTRASSVTEVKGNGSSDYDDDDGCQTGANGDKGFVCFHSFPFAQSPLGPDGPGRVELWPSFNKPVLEDLTADRPHGNELWPHLLYFSSPWYLPPSPCLISPLISPLHDLSLDPHHPPLSSHPHPKHIPALRAVPARPQGWQDDIRR